MKMRKLLATAVAASLAVTSMATVASAAEKSWNMGHTTGTIDLQSVKGTELGDEYYLTDEEFQNGSNTLGVSANSMILSVNTGDAEAITGVTLKVTGVKGTRGAASKTYSYKFENYKDEACTERDYDNKSKYWKLNVYEKTAPVDGFLPEQFLEFTKVELEATATTTVDNAKDYDAWGSSVWGSYNAATYNVVKGFGTSGDILAEIDSLAYAAWGFDYASNKTTSVDYPFMPVTEKDGNDKLGREEIRVLSVTNAWSSTDRDQGNDNSNQSYEGENTVDGEVKKDFAGLASQAADFFNKQTNGTVTFKFTTGTEAGGTAWENGGIPSTQTGIKNFLGDATANDFALFFNYKQTGSLQAITELDKDAGTVTFDISDILDAMGGQTLGTLDNIYYGLRKGIEYKDHGTGLMVETVTFAYDEDADVEADIEDDAEEDDADVEIEEDDDVEIEDDADDAEEDDADAAGDVVVEDEDDDANPGTGVALAVVPAMVAAAAVVLSKKRK
jgi:hypothetical protein